MDPLTLFGLFVVTAVLFCYALEDRNRLYISVFKFGDLEARMQEQRPVPGWVGGVALGAARTGRSRASEELTVRPLDGRVSLRSGQKSDSGPSCKPRDTHGMDDKAIRQAALITLRCAICERFPPGQERRAWLTWDAIVRKRGRPVPPSRSASSRRN